MAKATGAFEAWGSSLIGGLAGAVAVLLAVFLTAYVTNRKARETERRQAAAQLMVEVSNLRDAACSHRTGPIGDYALYPLRNRLYTTFVPLHIYESFHVVDQYYETVKEWRKWARDHDDRGSTVPQRARSKKIEEMFPWTTEYMTGLGEYGEDVIDVLKRKLEDKDTDFKPPALPAFIDTPMKVPRKTARAPRYEIDAADYKTTEPRRPRP
jgi:hypothetical protein